jgi:hypothetical protein
MAVQVVKPAREAVMATYEQIKQEGRPEASAAIVIRPLLSDLCPLSSVICHPPSVVCPPSSVIRPRSC